MKLGECLRAHYSSKKTVYDDRRHNSKASLREIINVYLSEKLGHKRK